MRKQAPVNRSSKPRGIDWTLAVHITPTPEKVATIAASHGYLAACERWGWLGPRPISNMIAEGKRRFGASKQSSRVDILGITAGDH